MAASAQSNTRLPGLTRQTSRWLGRITLAALFTLAAFLNGLQADSLDDYGAISDLPETTVRPGAVVWMDLLTSDVSAASNFYSNVFGWAIETSIDGDYAFATLNGRPVASIAAYDEDLGDAEGLWLPSISVADVDQAMEAVKKHGGAIVEPPENLPGRGRCLLIEDPTGAVVMLLRASGGDPERVETQNQWLWSELWTDDVEAATAFYENVAGYRTVTVRDGSAGEYQVMGRDQKPHASVVKTPLPDVEPNWLSYMLVDDVNAAAKRVLKAGGSVLLPPQKDGFNDDVAIVADPTGGVFALQQKEVK